MTKSRWFRVLICLLMVCCLIFHMSPIKAEALALEASLAIGLVGALILASAGVVFVPETTNQIQAIEVGHIDVDKEQIDRLRG